MAGREIVFGSGTASPTGGRKRVRKRAPMFTYYPKPILNGRACDIGSRPCIGGGKQGEVMAVKKHGRCLA